MLLVISQKFILNFDLNFQEGKKALYLTKDKFTS